MELAEVAEVEVLEVGEVADVGELVKFQSTVVKPDGKLKYKLMLKPDFKISDETMKGIQKLVWSTGTNADMRSGGHGVAGGVDGSLSHVTNRVTISYVYEESRGIGFDFGGGTGYTTLVFAHLTNYFMYSVEVTLMNNYMTFMIYILIVSSLWFSVQRNKIFKIKANTKSPNVDGSKIRECAFPL